MSRRAGRLLASLLGLLVGLPLLAIGVVYGGLQTVAGQRFAATALSSLLSSPGSRIEIDGLSGALPFHIRITSITEADGIGPWLRLQGVAVDLVPRDLLHRRLTLERVSVARIAVARSPAPSGGSSAPLSVPRLPIRVALGRLDLPNIVLAPPVLGQPVELAVAGQGDLADAVAHLALTLHRTDGAPGEAALSLALDGAPARLAVTARVAEPTGQVLAAILGRPDPLPVSAILDGAGLLSDWHGRLDVHAGATASVEAALTGAGDRYGASGTVRPGDLLPAELAPLIGDQVTIDAAGQAGAAVVLERLAVGLAAGRVEASGRYEPDSGRITASASLQLADLSRFGAIAGRPLAGSADLHASAGGTLTAPEAALRADLHDLQAEGVTIAALHLDASAASPGPLSARRGRFTLAGHAEGIAGARVPEPVAGGALDWSVAGQADGTARRIVLEQATLSGLGVSLAGQATLADGRADGHVDLTAADLARLAPLVGVPLAGDAALSLTLAADTGATRATLQGRLGAPRLGIPMADGMLGGAVTLDGAASLAGGAATLDRLDIQAEHARVSLAGRLVDGRLDGTAALTLPALAALGRRGLAGTLSVAGHATGALDHLAVTASVTGERLVADAARLDRVGADIAVPDLAARTGSVALRFAAGRIEGRADLAIDAADPQSLAIPKLSVAAAGARLDGSLRVAPAGPSATGTLTLHVPDLAPWSTLIGMPMQGALDGRIALSAPQGRQAATVAMTAPQLAAGGAVLHGLKLDADGSDLLRRPTGRATVDLAQATLGTAALSATRLRLEPAAGGTLQVDLATSGSYRGPFRLALAGAVTPGATTRLHLARLDGQLVGERLALARPVDVAVAPGRMVLGPTALSFGPGSLTASATLERARVAAQVTATGLPVARLAALGGVDGATGRLGFTLDLSGTTADPSARLTLEAADLRTSAGANLPALAVTAQARVAGQRLSADARITAPQGEALAVTAALPVILRLEPVAAGLPPDGALAVTASGAGRLEHLAELVPLGANSVAGAYRLDLRVGGTVAQPDIGGRLTLDQARYDNLETGTEIRDLSLDIAGDHRRVVVNRLTGTDGAQGRVTASGSGDLAGGPLALRLHLADFVVSRMDLARGTASGDVAVGGTAAAPVVTGAITITKAEIRLPERLPPSVADLPVIQVDSRRGQAAVQAELAAAAARPASPPVVAKLDVAVTLPGPVFVRGRGVDSEWRGRFTASGTSAAPQLVGGLTAIRGTVDVLGKTFTVQRGVIDFAGSLSDPRLDIEAQVQTADITAQALIGGTVTTPTFKLTSQPQLPQDEVLARVLFGRGVGQITPAEGLQLAQAAASLAGGGPGVLDRLRNLTGLDRLSVQNNPAAAPGAKGTTALSGGKYVANGVYVGVNQDISTGQTRAEVQVELTPSLSVDSKVGATSSTSLGLTWRKDY